MLTGLNGILLSLYAHVQVGRQALMRREEGQALVEYTLILALVSIAAVTILGTVGKDIVTKLEEVATAL